MKAILLTAMALPIVMLFAFKLENNMENTKEIGAVEIVIFSFKEDLSDQEAMKKAQLVNDFISSRKGFISRTTSKLEDGRWSDLVYWESLEEAKAANAEAMKCEPCGLFFSTIDEESTLFIHGETFIQLSK